MRRQDGICEICGSPYPRTRINRKYCSRVCKRRAKHLAKHPRVERGCKICGADLTDAHARRMFCGKACAMIGREQREMMQEAKLKTEERLKAMERAVKESNEFLISMIADLEELTKDAIAMQQADCRAPKKNLTNAANCGMLSPPMKKKSIKARIAERDLRFEELRIARDELESSKEKLAKARMRVKKAMRAVSAARVGVEDARKRHVASIEALSEQPPWPRPPNNAPSRRSRKPCMCSAAPVRYAERRTKYPSATTASNTSTRPEASTDGRLTKPGTRSRATNST